MVQSSALSGPIEGARRGACPTLAEPMRTGDGLLARIRVLGNRLSPVQLAELARLAGRHGNGLVEITARGNLQVRGLRPHGAAPFAAAVAALLPIETGIVVDTSPLAGEDPAEKSDSRRAAAAIRAGAAKLPGALGPKVSVVVDGGGQVSLAALKADVRLLAEDGGRWAVTLGGGRTQSMDEDGAVAAALAMLGALAAMGPESRATDLFPGPGPGPAKTRPNVGPFQLDTGATWGIALPFGAMHWKNLLALASAARAKGIGALRLAPGHALLLDGADAALIAQAATLGFITASDDPRLRTSACIGSSGCASGHIPGRELAAALAGSIPAGQSLHVSGCAKGCAHPRRADVTLVGRPDGIGLVIDGRAGDTPSQILDEAGIGTALAGGQEGR